MNNIQVIKVKSNAAEVLPKEESNKIQSEPKIESDDVIILPRARSEQDEQNEQMAELDLVADEFNCDNGEIQEDEQEEICHKSLFGTVKTRGTRKGSTTSVSSGTS